MWEGKLEFIGYYYMVDSYERELYSAGWVKIRIQDPGSGINIPDPQHCAHAPVRTLRPGTSISSLADPDPGSGAFFDIRDPGWKKVGSGINIPDPQHCA